MGDGLSGSLSSCRISDCISLRCSDSSLRSKVDVLVCLVNGVSLFVLLVGEGVRLVLRLRLESLDTVVLDVNEDIVESWVDRLSPEGTGVCSESELVSASLVDESACCKFNISSSM